MKTFNTIIIGAGLSGLYTALLIDTDKTVAIVVKDELAESNSWLAQGGIAAELNAEKAVLARHMDDTVTAGGHINDPEAVKVLVNEAEENIRKLIAFNIRFDQDQKGNLHLTREGGHTAKRVLHSGGDATGKDMIEALRKLVIARKNITLVEETMVYDLLQINGEIIGVHALDSENCNVDMLAENIIFATGGIGAVYASTTNAPVATGDGISICAAAGIETEKMAFVQFHPTALYEPNLRQQRRFLISEALRGEGAVLRNSEEEAFMEKYHKQGDLAPRDIVSQAIFREMYDTWTDHVQLDTRHLDGEYLKTRFPTIHQTLTYRGYTLGEDLIPVVPVQHFFIGGIKTDLDGRSSENHVYAVGETASTGVHGANRLAANSLLECVVFGNRIALHINAKERRPLKYEGNGDTLDTYNYNYRPLRMKLGRIMDEHVGVVRTHSGLTEAQSIVSGMLKTLLGYPNHSQRYYETRNMFVVSRMIIEEALSIKKSIGCHFRID